MWISVFSITSPSQTSDVFGKLRTSSADFRLLRESLEMIVSSSKIPAIPALPGEKSHAYISEKVSRYKTLSYFLPLHIIFSRWWCFPCSFQLVEPLKTAQIWICCFNRHKMGLEMYVGALHLFATLGLLCLFLSLWQIYSKNSGRSETLNSNALGTVFGKIRCLGKQPFFL